jgi:hypothetical protein
MGELLRLWFSERDIVKYTKYRWLRIIDTDNIPPIQITKISFALIKLSFFFS